MFCTEVVWTDKCTCTCLWMKGIFFISENEPSEAEQDEEEEDYPEDEVDEGKEPVLFLGHPG